MKSKAKIAAAWVCVSATPGLSRTMRQAQRFSRRWPMLLSALAALGLAAAAESSDVSSYSVAKGIHYTQTGFGAPVVKTTNGYVFEAAVIFQGNAVTNATVQPPLGTNHVLPPRLGYSELQLKHKYDTRTSLDTHYPDGWYTNRIYTVDDGTKTLPLLLHGAAYPNPPHLTDFPTLQMVYNNGYFMAAWDPFVGATTNDTIEFHIEDSLGNPVWDPPHEGSLPPDSSELLVYAQDFYNAILAEQVYKGTLTFRKMATVDTNAYPGAIGQAYYYAETSFNLLLSTNPSPDVAWYEVSKGRRFVQVDTNFPAPDSGQPYEFQAAVQASSPNLLSSATILLPNITHEPVLPQGDGIHFAWTATAPNQSALDASYGNGLYTFTLQTVNNSNRSVALPLSANLYPPSPRVANFEATQALASDQDFKIAWDPWVDGTSSDFVQLRIEDMDNHKYFETADPGKPGALDGRAADATVKAGTLTPSRSWLATVVFKRFQALNTTNYAGVLGQADYYARTKLILKTAAPPTLNYGRSGNHVVLSWPTNSGGFTLQSTLNFASPVLWLDLTNPPGVIGAQFTVTNTVSGNAQFYRLRKL